LRALLIDNYDSYTYNLFQLLAETGGVEPVVVRNDERAIADLRPADFDCAVISPGPGHPGSVRDFGLSRDVLCAWDLPSLGVCLGHQGMALLAGGVVGPAPVPRHGYLSRIRHDGAGLFAGLPSGFWGVRYHSLCAREPLAPDLEATAWAEEDGVVMGLRHLSRPWWGVQFHPESVATEHGRRLIENFLGLARRHRGRGTRVVLKSPPPGLPRVGARADFRVRWRAFERPVDPEAAFRRLYGESPHAFWLDSSLVEPGLSRFSFMGDASGPLAEVLTYRVGRGRVEVTDASGGVGEVPGDVFAVLSARLAGRRVEPHGLPFDFACGYAGHLGYELKADLGSASRHRAETPDAAWIFADRMIAFDHEAGRVYALALEGEGSPGDAAERWLDRTLAVLAGLPPALVTSDVAAGDWDPEPWMARDRRRYVADVEACHRKLVAGESYEICLTNKLRVTTGVSGLDLYLRLRRLNPAPYSAFLRLGEVAVAGSSPERFIRIDRDGRVESKPIKGTAARSPDGRADWALRRGLEASGKDRAENLMIVDLVRNDLGRVCEVGSVAVSHFGAIESYATVHQLVSTVEGRLRPGIGPVECVRACFPGGSMTGAPKHRTMEIIDSLESEARGIYSGALGWLGLNGTADLSIVIRTAVLRGGELTIGGGGAIVLESDPEREWEEMLLKVRAPLRALGGLE
jgi:para-aminobenzoate synthetase